MEEIEQEPVVKRGPGRPRLVRDIEGQRDPIRADAIRTRQRMRKGGQAKDRFDVPASLREDGTSYEWKRASTLGKPDNGHLIEMREQGWLPADTPELRAYFMPEGYEGAIERDGLILMERPEELTWEAREEDKRLARDVVRSKEIELGAAPAGQFARDNKGTPLAQVSRTIERGEVPVE